MKNSKIQKQMDCLCDPLLFGRSAYVGLFKSQSSKVNFHASVATAVFRKIRPRAQLITVDDVVEVITFWRFHFVSIPVAAFSVAARILFHVDFHQRT